MDHKKIGQLITSLRKEKGLTQKQLSELLHVSDRAVSKWERGAGCPDISLLQLLCDIFSISMEQLLQGDLEIKDQDSGNMKKVKFYVCPTCGNVLCATQEADISCCGRKLEPLQVQKELIGHQVTVDEMDDELYVQIDHEMRKLHYLSFAAIVCMDRVMLVKLYPEQSAEVRFPQLRGRKQLYLYCTQHGLWKIELGIKRKG